MLSCLTAMLGAAAGACEKPSGAGSTSDEQTAEAVEQETTPTEEGSGSSGAAEEPVYPKLADIKGTVLAACGSSVLNLIDVDTALDSGFVAGRLWRWQAGKHKAEIGSDVTLDHLDECKYVRVARPADGSEDAAKDSVDAILLTSSYGWWTIVEYPSGDCLYTGRGVQTHSAELLPGGLIAIANSTGGDTVKLYSLDDTATELASLPLTSAHGVVWMEKTKRLYAVGNYSLLVIKLTGLEEGTPAEQKPGFELEKTISTQGHVYNLHDLTKVDEGTMVLSGYFSSFFDVSTETFSETPMQQALNNVKAFNYNSTTGEAWYNCATPSEASESWATRTLRYSNDLSVAGDVKTIKIPTQDIYKVRVVKW